jgi:hypothetical protein
LISGHARNSRTIFWTSAAGVWYRTIEAFIIIMCCSCYIDYGCCGMICLVGVR